ncbi:unnamed protein product, partial [Ectocarpus fasciculatus]
KGDCWQDKVRRPLLDFSNVPRTPCAHSTLRNSFLHSSHIADPWATSTDTKPMLIRRCHTVIFVERWKRVPLLHKCCVLGVW